MSSRIWLWNAWNWARAHFCWPISKNMRLMHSDMPPGLWKSTISGSAVIMFYCVSLCCPPAIIPPVGSLNFILIELGFDPFEK